ncbi:MAG: hypothetical protein SYC29_17480 [Planctomycetota bacterium]|nr:hypothetical protein [Planctomycetota bacterium]
MQLNPQTDSLDVDETAVTEVAVDSPRVATLLVKVPASGRVETSLFRKHCVTEVGLARYKVECICNGGIVWESYLKEHGLLRFEDVSQPFVLEVVAECMAKE